MGILGTGTNAFFALVIGAETLKPSDGNGFTLLPEHAEGFALGLLGADPAADGWEGVCSLDLLNCPFKVFFTDQLDKAGDVNVYGAAFHTLRVLAVKAAGGFCNCIFFRIAKSHLIEISCPDLRGLLGHRSPGFLFLTCILAHFESSFTPSFSAGRTCICVRILPWLLPHRPGTWKAGS